MSAHVYYTLPTVTLQLYNFDLFKTSRTSSFCTVACNWQDFNWHDASRGPSAMRLTRLRSIFQFNRSRSPIIIGNKCDMYKVGDIGIRLCLLRPIPSLSWIRYDTIRDAILTCARKPTWVSLIHRTEPTTKKCKNRKKLKVENRYAQK